jgi:hypothetical protein
MIVVKIVGGLGNQMFQYTLYRKFSELGREAYYDSLQTKEHNGFELDKVFNIIPKPIVSLESIHNLKVMGETFPKFNPAILLMDNIYLEGNWQNINYFPDQNNLRKEFSFKQELDEKNRGILEEIQNSNSVSIHVRKTDYGKYAGYIFQADWMNYYGIAVNYITKNIKERPLKFFVFSDDIEWCKKNFMIPVIFVENKKIDGWKDMLLMSNCKHNITANSTFSWWGAWLNKNENKIVTTPKRWFLDNTDSNLITLNTWIKI